MPSQISKITSVTVQSVLMCIASNLIAQSITNYKAGTSFTLDWHSISQFVAWAVISTPPNYLLQQYLEHLLPSQIPTSPSRPPPPSEKHTPPNPPNPPTKLSIPNTLLKFAFDQTLLATINTLGFSAGLSLIRGSSKQAAWEKARGEYWGMMSAGWKLWPFVSLASYSVVKTVEGRQLVGGLAGLGWGVYLSLFYR